MGDGPRHLRVARLAGGLTVQTTFVTALSVVPQRLLPRGSSLVNSTRQVIQAIAVAVLATVLISTLSPAVRQAQAQAQEAQHVSNVPQPGLCEPIPASATIQPSADALALRQQACAENIIGFERTYRDLCDLELMRVDTHRATRHRHPHRNTENGHRS